MVTAMRENDYLPSACPVCGYLGHVSEFIKRPKTDKYHLRLVCPQCGATTDYFESISEATDAWLNGEVEEAGDDA